MISIADNISPVVLIALPSSSYFLGSFDVTNFRSFWLSRALPGQIDYIKKGIHIYGRSHLAIAKLVDGSWKVCKSKNYGIDWFDVFTTSEEIYEITLIRYGWAILNTSGGFYETINAGSTWTKVADLPAAPKAPCITNIGIANDTEQSGIDVLMCTDGRYIWRSVDYARHWTAVLDQQALTRIYNTGPYSSWQRFTYSGLSSPCIAGACDLVICGHGPYISLSLDGGLHWEDMQRWAMYFEGNCNSTLSVVWARMGRANSNPPPFVIKQLLIEEVDGPTADDIHFILRYDDRTLMPGESVLYSRVFRSRSCQIEAIPIIFDYKFQQYISPNDNLNQLSAFNLPITGRPANETSKLVFSAQTRIDSTGKQVISLKYSSDGGLTWIDINPALTPINDSSGLPLYNLGSLDDSFAKNTWVHGACDNHGHWVSSGWRRQNLSYEMDIIIERYHVHNQQFAIGMYLSKKKPKTVQLDTILERLKSRNFSLSAYLWTNKTKTVQLDAIFDTDSFMNFSLDGVFEAENLHNFREDVMIEGFQSKLLSLDSILSIQHSQDLELDAILQAKIPKTYRLGLLLGGKTPVIFQLDMMLERYRLNQRLSKMENITPQFLDLDVPFIPSTPYNSSLETL